MTNKSFSERFPHAEDVAKAMGGTLWGPPGPRYYDTRKALEQGAQIRDQMLQQLPILPEAVSVFQQLASTREWVVSGKPKQVARCIEWLNETRSTDPVTGFVELGYESFLKRRAMDYVCIGRTAFYHPSKLTGQMSNLEYIDPVGLIWQVKDSRQPVQDNQKVWGYYRGKTFRFNEIAINHPIPVGTGGFASPISPVIPSARLAWLLREHNLASVDGRKLREIILVSGLNVKEELEEAIDMVAAMFAGADPESVGGVPIMEIPLQAGAKMKDQIGRLGISEIPESLDAEEFIFQYVNEIAAGLGLALRHFWNNERTTNRALEVVQEQRQQQKGPATFVRTEQRLMNRLGGPMDLFSSRSDRTRFGFIEEIDSSSRKDHAEILKLTTEALQLVATVFGAGINLESYLAWMQSLQVLPNELELVTDAIDVQMVNPDQQNVNQEGETTGSSDAPVIPITAPKSVDYDEITMNGSGEIVDRRIKMFTIERVLSRNQKDTKAVIEQIDATSEDAFEKALQMTNLLNQATFISKYTDIAGEVSVWVEAQHLFDRVVAQEAVSKCLDKQPLSADEQQVIDELVSRFINDLS